MRRLTFALAALFLTLSCGETPTDTGGGLPTPSSLSIQLHADTSVYASWTQCPDGDFDAYILWRSGSAGIAADPSQAQAVAIFQNNPLQNTLTDTTVVPGETYWYALETRNTSLLSSWSNEESLTVPLNEPENLTVFFIDPSYGSLSGDAILVRTPNGSSYLIDGGDYRSYWSCGEDRILPLLDSLGITELDGIVATHPHSDHIGGLSDVIDAMPVEKVWDCGWTGEASSAYEYFLETVADSDAEYIVGHRGMTLNWDPDLTVVILNPEAYPGTGDMMNNASIVIRITFEGVSMLFTGDLETDDGEDVLLSLYTPEQLRADVLKVGHHGSYTSTSSQWLDAVDPSIAAIEVGSGNPYGHPHSEVLNRLDSRGIPVYRTDQDGTFVVTTDGIDITVF
ncbi:MAG TPA: ComEC/Rec2 family competence protein [Candidatus Sabulitectum sp.]|nr:ComEC/Rec2 family competence protein [Candidatus Sabulitectum sp.]HPJ29069.1 ComEC/Rec2 family competence protein [Candidatus Sabulitectum sp.]HPR22865.1 ComEC/Rec2 family competence protein [Candidatus Sabulitectum sp.]